MAFPHFTFDQIWDRQQLDQHNLVPDYNYIGLLNVVDTLQRALIKSHDAVARYLNVTPIQRLPFSQHEKAIYAAQELVNLMYTFEYCTNVLQQLS